MVPALLYLLYKKLRQQDWKKIKNDLHSRLMVRSNKIIFMLTVLLLFLSFVLSAQSLSRNYKIVRKDKEIGWANIQRTVDSNAVFYAFASEVKTSFLFTFSSYAREISEFRDGTLRHSYFYRKLNGSIKADRHTRLIGGNYEVDNKAEKTKLNIVPVSYNTLCMYFEEPVGRKQVYSDNYQCFLDIKKESDGGYTITYDGTSNSFYYSKGICTRIEINSSFYSATLILK
jgi:hypothetical protein